MCRFSLELGFLFCVKSAVKPQPTNQPCFLCVIYHSVPVLFASVVLGLVYSVLSQEIGQEEHLQNDLFCVE